MEKAQRDILNVLDTRYGPMLEERVVFTGYIGGYGPYVETEKENWLGPDFRLSRPEDIESVMRHEIENRGDYANKTF